MVGCLVLVGVMGVLVYVGMRVKVTVGVAVGGRGVLVSVTV